MVPLLVGGYLVLQRRRRAFTARFTNLELLAAVAPRTPGWRRHVPPILFLLSLVVLLGALARPVVTTRVPKEQASIVLVVDTSRSMTASDLEPDRITAAKRAASEFVDSLPEGIRVGLVSFDNTAGVVSPLTRDRAQVQAAISSLEPQGGTAIGDGLGVALSELSRDGADVPSSVLLLSDGQATVGRPPAEVAPEAAAMNVPVYTVGLGKVGTVLDFMGRIIPVDVNEQELRGMAEATGAEYFRSEDTDALVEVYQNLGSRLGSEEEPREVTDWTAGLGAFLLVAGGLSSLLWFQRIP